MFKVRVCPDSTVFELLTIFELLADRADVKGGDVTAHPCFASVNLTLNLPVDSEYVVA